jgi:hypothetical protein
MAKERNEGRRHRKAAEEAAAMQRRRRNTLWLRGAGVLLVIGAAAYGYRAYSTRQLLAAVTTATYPAARHVAGHIDYKESPPIGGPHNVVWQNCGTYDAPIHNEHAVHALEHGAVWITYRPDLPASQVATLKDAAADDYMLLSPYPGLPSPVVATAWNHQLRLDGAADKRLRVFIDKYKNNPDNTPEFGAPCAGGTSALATADSLNLTPGRTPGPADDGAPGPIRRD